METEYRAGPFWKLGTSARRLIMHLAFITPLLVTLLAIAGPAEAEQQSDQPNWREEYAYLVGKQAYIYGYPAIKFAAARYDWIEGHKGSVRALGNVYTHFPKLVEPDYQYGTSMNRDTLYSLAWVYVGEEPMVLVMPENPDGRYYSIELCEFYTDAFGYMGSRTTGNEGGVFLVHGPGWQGTVPEGIDGTFESPTPWFVSVGRTYTTNTVEDLEQVHRLQAGYKIYPLSEWNREEPQVAAPITDVLDAIVGDDPLQSLEIMNAAMRENPPPARDAALMTQFALVGLGPEASVQLDELDEDTRRGLRRAVVDAHALLGEVSRAVGSITNKRRTVNGWAYNPSNWGRMAESGDFLGRAATQSFSGGIENLVEEAVKLRAFTDNQGQPLDGNKRYVLKFSKEQIPRAKAFWSITLYDNNYNLVLNEAEKYAIRDIDQNIQYGEDGSLTIYLQQEAPEEQNVNWIPTPKDEHFNLFFRAYLPSRDFLDQSYVPPHVQLID